MGAMNLKNKDFDFLENLAEKLSNNESFIEESKELHLLLSRLSDKREKDNIRTAKIIAERRGKNPFYGRSKKECDRIESKIIYGGTDMEVNNKIEYARNMCRIRGLKHRVKGEALFILNNNTKHFEQVCFSILNLSKEQINEMLDIYKEKI